MSTNGSVSLSVEDQADGLLLAFDRAAENLAVEANHAVEVDDAQDDVIELTYADHGRFLGWLNQGSAVIEVT